MLEETFWKLLFIKISKKYGVNLLKTDEHIIFDISNDGNLEIIIDNVDFWVLDVKVNFNYEDLTTIIEETDYFIQDLTDMKNIIKEIQFYKNLLRTAIIKKSMIEIYSEKFELFYIPNIDENKNLLLKIHYNDCDIYPNFIYEISKNEILTIKENDNDYDISNFLEYLLDIEKLPLFEIIDYGKSINFLNDKLNLIGK